MEIILSLAAAIIAFSVAWEISRRRFSQSEKAYLEQVSALEKENIASAASLQGLEEKNQFLLKTIEDGRKELTNERDLVVELNKKLSFLESDHKNLQEKLKTHKEEVEKLQEQFSFQFRNLANDIFEEKSKRFTDQNKTNISELLNPLKDRIIEFEKKIDHSSKESLISNASLKEQISGLRELNIQMSREAENLTKALKGESKTQGSWGEFILESILEKSGLVKDREYFIQESFKTDEGKRYQPDVVVRLPEGKSIIVDAKVSLSAYERYFNSEDEEEKAQHLKDHLLSIRMHIKSLSEKSYQKLYGIGSLDFVLLFIPVEPALGLAIQSDNSLFNSAFDKNIIIVSPSTLLATLRTISSIWKQEYQTRNAMEIARQSGDLYDKFVGFVQDLNDLGTRISAVRDTYDKAMNKLYTGKGNLVSRTERIRGLGAGASKVLPQDLIDKAEEGEKRDWPKLN